MCYLRQTSALSEPHHIANSLWWMGLSFNTAFQIPTWEHAIRHIHLNLGNRRLCLHRCGPGSAGLFLNLTFVDEATHHCIWLPVDTGMWLFRLPNPETLGSSWWAPFCTMLILKVIFNNFTCIHCLVLPLLPLYCPCPPWTLPINHICDLLRSTRTICVIVRLEVSVGTWWPQLWRHKIPSSLRDYV